MNKETKSKYYYAAVLLGQNQKGKEILDSGTTDHFSELDSKYVDKQMKNEGVKVKFSNSSFIQSTHTALLDISHLAIEARRAHLFPGIAHTLISISMMCDQGYLAIFDTEMVYILKMG